jgi:hypothetical protein
MVVDSNLREEGWEIGPRLRIGLVDNMDSLCVLREPLSSLQLGSSYRKLANDCRQARKASTAPSETWFCLRF